MNTNLEKQMHKLNRWNANNNSHATRCEYLTIMKKFLEFCSGRKIQSIKNIGNKQVRAYIEERLADEISSITLKKEMAAIRHFSKLESAMRGDESKITVTNAQLGILPEAAKLREGLYEDEIKTAKKLAEKNGQDGAMSTAIDLGLHLGLRSREIFCMRVSTIVSAVSEKGDGILHIIHGTKGGRPRDIALSDKQKNILIEALDRHGKELNMTDRLLSKGKDGVKSQLSRWHNFWSRNQDNIAREGRSEDDRPAAHSLRRQYARNEFNMMVEAGVPEKAAANRVSALLGHGPSRKDITCIYLGI
ncbi:MAG: integrase domain-containing protein [Oscillospiraceae bacterium]|nr:integrase domain-containing protein [Oscillospiraceae bacterium]